MQAFTHCMIALPSAIYRTGNSYLHIAQALSRAILGQVDQTNFLKVSNRS